MELYNSLTRSTQPFMPLDGKTVRVYTCGPTVYNNATIGNLRSYVFADTLHRALELAGFTVTRAMNYTDVDDKTIRRSRELYADSPPMEALKKLTQQYIDVFLADMAQLGNRTDNLVLMPATDYIEQMKTLVSELHDQGFAYIADDGVYFSIDAYKKSGKTYGQLLELTAANTSEARIQNDEYDKESVHDFALWKVQKDGEPAWDFTLDGRDLTGRPGWHIECSAMSRTALNQPFDIHTGGVDNIFPHHENEIAQSTAGHDNPTMAQFFVHGEHLLVDNGRMGKSLNNFYTVDDLVKKGFDPLAFRLLVLQGHYRSQINFTWDSLEAAQNRLQALRALADLRFQQVGAHGEAQDYSAASQQIVEALSHDLKTPAVLRVVAEVENLVALHGIAPEQQESFTAFLQTVEKALGLRLLDSSDITSAQKDLLAQRQEARATKDWALADTLRDQLATQGIGVRDTDDGAIWFRL